MVKQASAVPDHLVIRFLSHEGAVRLDHHLGARLRDLLQPLHVLPDNSLEPELLGKQSDACWLPLSALTKTLAERAGQAARVGQAGGRAGESGINWASGAAGIWVGSGGLQVEPGRVGRSGQRLTANEQCITAERGRLLDKVRCCRNVRPEPAPGGLATPV